MAERDRSTDAAAHMPDAIDIRGVGAGALAVAAAIAASLLAGFAMMRLEGASIARPSASTPPAVAGAVSLQPAPLRDIRALREAQQRLLSEYAWVDRERGIVRIPIERAMALLASQPRASPADAPDAAISPRRPTTNPAAPNATPQNRSR
jgi:hypothetical protein